MAQFTSDIPSSPEVTINVCGGVEIRVPANRWQELRKAEWFNPTRQAMAALPWDADNWTTDGVRTQPSAVVDMLAILVKVLDNRTPPPSVVPTWRGGVQVEWHRNNVDFEIQADPQGEIEYFFSGPHEECEGRAWDDLNQLAEYVQAITVSE